MAPTPRRASLFGIPGAPDKILDETIDGRWVVVKIPAHAGAVILTPHPWPVHGFAPDLVWTPGAAKKVAGWGP